VKGRRIASLLLAGTTLLVLGGCEGSQEAGEESSNLERLKKALPGARVEQVDPEQMKNLGPSAVPGILPDYQLTVVRKRALAGDGPSAYTLFHHYDLVGNDAEAQAWTRIGAENGEYNSMMLMGFASEQQGGIDGCMRAVYWFTRARGELENDLKSAGPEVPRENIEALIRTADDEITSARAQSAGC